MGRITKRKAEESLGFYFLSILILVSACTPKPETEIPELKDGGIVSHDPCGPPCFWNITPDNTTEAEVVDILKNRGLFPFCEAFDNEAESGDRGIICRPYVIVTFQPSTNIVASLGFRPSQNITVEEIISKYGDPDSVLVTGRGIPEGEQKNAMMLYYDDLQMNLVLPEQEGGTYNITALVQVESIGYSDFASYTLLKRYATPWNGYGQYEEIHP